MSKIVIDCRYLGMSGIGRVLEGYITNISNTKTYNIFYYLGNKEKLSKYNIVANVIEDNNSPVSKKGLFVDKEINEFDAFFTPNFIIPLGVKIPVYTMIHDLMFKDFLDTTNGFVDKKIKNFFYKRCIKKSKCIFTVSEFTKKRILHYYPKCKCDIVLVYNGLSKSIMDYKANNSSVEKENYIIFVGNIKKQKGIGVLLKAIENTNQELYLVGDKNNFRTSDDTIDKYMDKPNIHFTGRVNDDELFDYISKAKFLIQPSFYEGFGIPPLEALYLGTRPIISDIEVFKEIYQNTPAVYFKVGDSDDLLDKINNTDNTVSELDKEILDKYSYLNGINVILNNIK